MMKYPVYISKRVAVVFVTAAAIIVATGLLESGRSRGQAANANAPQESGAKSNTSGSEAALDLSPSQLNSIKIEPVGSYLFPVEKEGVCERARRGGAGITARACRRRLASAA